MKIKFKRTIAAAALMMVCAGANAQYWQLANQATDMVSTIFSAGANYRGFADVSYLAGVGNKRADILEFSTTQGAQLSSHFFMGLGLGVDIMFTSVPDGITYPPNASLGGHGFTTTGVAIPLYSDFRLDIGNKSSSNMYVDLRLGASFLAGNKYIQVGDGYLTNSQCFYLRPSVGMRVPVSPTSKCAFNISVSYQLLTSSYWYVSNNNTTLNAIGVNVGFEW